MKKLKFNGQEVEISDDKLSKDVFDIDFGGAMVVQFTKQRQKLIGCARDI
jgi:hypothetical protein